MQRSIKQVRSLVVVCSQRSSFTSKTITAASSVRWNHMAVGETKKRSKRKTRITLGFEYQRHVVQMLNEKYSFKVQNTSKQSHDQGVDFHGEFVVSNSGRSVSVIGQCKREHKQVGVNAIRELQGTLSQFNNCQFLSMDDQQSLLINNNNSHHIGILVSNSGYTTFGVRFAQQCSDGIILCTMKRNVLDQFIMNTTAKKLIGSQFITGIQVALDDERRSDGDANRMLVFYEKKQSDDGHEVLERIKQ